MRKLLWVVTTAVLCTGAASAQFSGNNITPEPGLSALRINLVGSAPCRSMIGIQARSEMQASIAAAEIVPSTMTDASIVFMTDPVRVKNMEEETAERNKVRQD